MAFNVMHTFHRNKRFWMAAILMVCMVSFVFCTGGATDKLTSWLPGQGGATVFSIAGHSYGIKQLDDLRRQRNLANKLLMNCSDLALKKLNKQYFELGQKQNAAPGKEAQARVERLTEIEGLRQSIAYKKSRPRFFEGGVKKYDDLVEFTMWQAVADKLGIDLDDAHVKYLYYMEFYAYSTYRLDPPEVMEQEINITESRTLREDFRDGSPALIRKALAAEFRARIAQEAVLLSQPLQFLGRKKQDGLGIKLFDPDVPDEVRAPITLAQLWDQFKQTRAEFDATLLPLDVEKFVKDIKAEPTEEEKEKFFDKYKDVAADPSTDPRGLQMPVRVKIEYVLADPTSPAYLDSARLFEQLQLLNPFAPDAVLAPLTTATRYWAVNGLHRAELEKQYENLGKNDRQPFPFASSFAERDCVTPILARLANRHPQAAAQLVGSALLSPNDGFGALAGYLAWGALPEEREALDLAVHAEMKRRAPVYAAIIAASASGFPLDVAVPYLVLPYLPYPRKLPLEAVQKEMEEILIRRAAEEKAQQNMQIVRAALVKAEGDEAKFKRDLDKFVPEMKLTYGPADKNASVTRYDADTSPAVAPLYKAYLKYLDTINLFEGRDLTPERLLKRNTFFKLFFDSSETFSAATPYKAMPWPPLVKANAARVLKQHPDPRLINPANVDPKAAEEFVQQMMRQNPLAPVAPPPFDGLFNTAEKPILFWRTAERIPQRPSKYADIARDIAAREADVKTNGANLKKLAVLAPAVDALRKREIELTNAKADPNEIEKVRTDRLARRSDLLKMQNEAGGDLKALTRRETDLKEDIADLKEIQRLIVAGWKFDRARSTEVLPVAKLLAESYIKNRKQGMDVLELKYGLKPFPVKRLCAMFPEEAPGGATDYGKPLLPKDNLLYPRADMADELVRLYDLSKPITIGNDSIYKRDKEIADLDELNRELFERVAKGDNPRGNYVQILTNKPRSVYYVAFTPLAAAVEKREFIEALRFAPFEMTQAGELRPRDRWVERIQQKDGRTDRAAVVASLKKIFDYGEVSEEARKRFDDQVVGD